METLRVQNIRKTFKLSKKQRKIEQTETKLKVAVDDVTFTAYPGEIFGLLGPNGAGKTTVMRCIATLIKADKGDIFVGAHSVLTQSHTVRKKLAFLTHELKLEDHFTPNFLFKYFSRLHGVEDAIALERKTELFNRFGIDKFQEVKVADLSTGMKQKISIAISLVHDPDVIIFDEPTNGLDILTAKTVTDYLLNLKDRGKTIILSTHILQVVEKMCDRVAIIIDGKIQVCDTLDDLLTANKNEDLESLFFKLMLQTSGESYA